MTSDVRKALAAAGFTEEALSDVDRALGMAGFVGKRMGDWVPYATVHPQSEPHIVEVALNKSHAIGGLGYGTKHCFATAAALERKLANAMADLERLAANEALLKCPKCGIRYVIPKKGKNGVFLSCEGMTRVHRQVEGRRQSDVACRGTSNRIPAIVVHR